jgi:hypothetical protein
MVDSRYLLTLRAFNYFTGDSTPSSRFIVLFEIGSPIYTTAPNSVALILCRPMVRFESSGILPGGLLIVSKIIPLHRRPMCLSIM